MFPVSILRAYCSYFLLNDFKPRLALPKDPDQYRHTKTGKKCRILLQVVVPKISYKNPSLSICLHTQTQKLYGEKNVKYDAYHILSDNHTSVLHSISIPKDSEKPHSKTT